LRGTQYIPSPLHALLDTCDEFDGDSKKALMTTAITSNNTALQHELLHLQGSKESNADSQAKLAKELMKLADLYKLTELQFDIQTSTNDSTTILPGLPNLALSLPCFHKLAM
jgi:hypothetical protein